MHVGQAFGLVGNDIHQEAAEQDVIDDGDKLSGMKERELIDLFQLLAFSTSDRSLDVICWRDVGIPLLVVFVLFVGDCDRCVWRGARVYSYYFEFFVVRIHLSLVSTFVIVWDDIVCHCSMKGYPAVFLPQ